MRRVVVAAVCAAIGIGLAGRAGAAVVTYDFSATYSFTEGTPTGLAAQAAGLQHLTGSFSYDTDAPITTDSAAFWVWSVNTLTVTQLDLTGFTIPFTEVANFASSFFVVADNNEFGDQVAIQLFYPHATLAPAVLPNPLPGGFDVGTPGSGDGSEIAVRAAGGSAVHFAISSLTEVVAPVPEPSSWALMLAGFAAVGGAVRSRRAAARRFPGR